MISVALAIVVTIVCVLAGIESARQPLIVSDSEWECYLLYNRAVSIDARQVAPAEYFAALETSEYGSLPRDGRGIAVLMYSDAIRCKPDFAEAHQNLGLLLDSMRMFELAAHHHWSAAASSFDSSFISSALVNWAVSMMQQNQVASFDMVNILEGLWMATKLNRDNLRALHVTADVYAAISDRGE